MQATGAGATINWTNGTGLATISTGGASTPAVQADAGGAISLTPTPFQGTVSTSADGSTALFATGTGSTITASGVRVATGNSQTGKGDFSFGLLANGGAGISFTGGSITTLGTNAPAVLAETINGGAGSVALSGGTTIVTAGQQSAGLMASGAGASVTAAGISVKTIGNNSAGAYNGSSTGIPAGGSMSITNSPVITFGSGSDGVVANSGGQTTVSGGAVVTSGSAALGLFASGSGSSIATNGTTITTSGASAYGAQADANGAITVNGGSVNTVGGLAFGVVATNGGSVSVVGASATLAPIGTTELSANAVDAAAGGAIDLSYAKVTTSANGAAGLVVTGSASSLTAAHVTVNTSGGIDTNTGYYAHGVYNGPGGSDTAGGTLDLRNASVTVGGQYVSGVYTGAGGQTTITGGSVATNGLNSYGVVSSGGSTTTLGGTSVTASKDGSRGLLAEGSGTTLDATDVRVTTSGNSNSSTGNFAQGLLSTQGALVTFDGGSVTTSGSAATAVSVNRGGVVRIQGATIRTSGDGSAGLAVHSAGSEIDATGAIISTTGGHDAGAGNDAYGAFNGPYGNYPAGGILNLTDTTISTQIAQMHGVVTALGGATTILGGSVTTHGDGAVAVLSENGGTTTVGSSANGPAQLSTQGTGAYVAVATTGGKLALSGLDIATSADGSGGLAVTGSGSQLDATGVTVATSGGFDSVSGQYAYAAYNGAFGASTSGGVLNLANSSLSTQGDRMAAVFTGAGGSTSMTGSSAATAGTDAVAFEVVGPGAGAVLSGTNNLTTTGDGGIGLYATSGGKVAAPNGQTNISTSGAISESTGMSAFGVFADGPGASIQLAGATITTTGDDAVGLYAGSSTGSTGGGSIAVTGPLSVKTGGAFADGAWASMPGAAIALGGPSTFVINGDSAFGLDATDGGAIAANGPLSITNNGTNGGGVQAYGPGSAVTLHGTTNVATNGPDSTGLFAAYGGALSLLGPTTVAVNGANSVGALASSASITASGQLNVTTLDASSAAFTLTGGSPTITATGGGTVTAAGTAVSFHNASNAIATFDNFTFNGGAGDLIFVDPSFATLNFNNTIANAGSGALLNVTQGSVFTLNANASLLTGSIQTSPTSTTNVNLTNGSVWTMTGSSFVSNLAVTRSGVVFAPAGGTTFNTLTVNNWIGSGASLTMNAQLGGAGSTADQLVINGGKATGTTAVTVRNVGGTGGQTTGSGILLISATNGGSIAPGAFALASTPVVNGYKYTLTESSNAWYLVSSPTATQADIINSVSNLAVSQQQQMITNRILTSILLGATEQINCSNCSSGFGSIGSYSIGAHGRWSLSDQLTVIGGFSYGGYSADGVTVQNAPMFAGALVYDMVNLGRSRPFFEVGGGLTPYSDVSYSRSYLNGTMISSGYGQSINRNLAVFGRMGWVDRLTPIDEAAVYADISRNWMQTSGYTEVSDPNNPYPMSLGSGVDTLNIARLGGQWTHLFNGVIEANVSAAVAYGFNPTFGSPVSVVNFVGVQPYALKNSTWMEYGAETRLSLQ